MPTRLVSGSRSNSGRASCFLMKARRSCSMSTELLLLGAIELKGFAHPVAGKSRIGGTHAQSRSEGIGLASICRLIEQVRFQEELVLTFSLQADEARDEATEDFGSAAADARLSDQGPKVAGDARLMRPFDESPGAEHAAALSQPDVEDV